MIRVQYVYKDDTGYIWWTDSMEVTKTPPSKDTMIAQCTSHEAVQAVMRLYGVG